jgi:predicted ester cyclase
LRVHVYSPAATGDVPRIFRNSFPDLQMEIGDLVAEREKVAAHFRCSGTHLGEWMGHPPMG